MITNLRHLRFFFGSAFAGIYYLVSCAKFLLIIVLLCELISLVCYLTINKKLLPDAVFAPSSLVSFAVIDDRMIAATIFISVFVIHFGGVYGYELFRIITPKHRQASNIEEIDATYLGWILPRGLRLAYALFWHIVAFLFFCSMLSLIAQATSNGSATIILLFLSFLAMTIVTEVSLTSFISDLSCLPQSDENKKDK